MRFNSKRIISGLFFVSMVLAVTATVFFRQPVYDWWRLRDYAPSAEVSALAEITTMTDEAQHIFYATHPAVTDAETFNQNCHIEEFSIILGCYVSRSGLVVSGNIFVFDVTDKRLKGIREVTAAHEMLHAAYDRLDASERERINTLLVNTYKTLDNQRIKDTVAQYQDNNPASVPNELHSILGTEVRKLPGELETYYARYFADRSAVVTLSETYEAEFSSRQNRVQQIDKQLTALKIEIEFNQALLGERNGRLMTERTALNQLRVSDVVAYNQRVEAYNRSVNEYNALVNATRRDIQRHNRLVKQRNSLVVEVQDLMQAIDSTPSRIE